MSGSGLKVIVLSELDPEYRDMYLDFLAEKNVEFVRDRDGCYVATVVAQSASHDAAAQRCDAARVMCFVPYLYFLCISVSRR